MGLDGRERDVRPPRAPAPGRPRRLALGRRQALLRRELAAPLGADARHASGPTVPAPQCGAPTDVRAGARRRIGTVTVAGSTLRAAHDDHDPLARRRAGRRPTAPPPAPPRRPARPSAAPTPTARAARRGCRRRSRARRRRRTAPRRRTARHRWRWRPSESAARPLTATVDRMARPPRLVHRRDGGRLDADDLHPVAEPRRHPGDEPAAADGDQHGVDARHLARRARAPSSPGRRRPAGGRTGARAGRRSRRPAPWPRPGRPRTRRRPRSRRHRGPGCGRPWPARSPTGTKISARCPRARATWATATPWLPPDAATTPAAGTSAASTRLKAPRGLNEPACCSSSSLSVSGTGDAEGARLEGQHRRLPHVAGDAAGGLLDVGRP